MSEQWSLPPSWAWTSIAEVAGTTSGGTPRRDKPEYYGGSIPWLKSGELNDALVTSCEEFITDIGLKSSSAKLFPKGTLCIALYGATVGKLGVLDFESSTNQAVCGIFPHSGISTRFLFRYLQLIRPKLIEAGKGGAQPNISQAIVRSTSLPLAPENEQTRISDVLDAYLSEIDAAVAALERVQVNLKRYRASVLKAASEGRFARSASTSRCLAELLSEPLANGRSPVASQSGIAILKLTALRDGRIDFSETRLGDVPESNRTSLRIRAGDMFVSRGNGSLRLVGIGGVVTSSPEEDVIFPDTMIRIRLNKEIVDLRYFAHLWNSLYVRRQIERAARTTAGIYKISQSDLLRIEVPIPSIQAQEAIAAKLDDLTESENRTRNVVQGGLLRADRLRQSILKRAFEGKLVPQDSNDEPASVLLERVRANKSQSANSHNRALARKARVNVGGV